MRVACTDSPVLTGALSVAGADLVTTAMTVAGAYLITCAMTHTGTDRFATADLFTGANQNDITRTKATAVDSRVTDYYTMVAFNKNALHARF
jgi:uncharacterized membrane protein